MSKEQAIEKIINNVHADIHYRDNLYYGRYNFETDFIAAGLMAEEDRTVTLTKYNETLVTIKAKLEAADAKIQTLLQ